MLARSLGATPLPLISGPTYRTWNLANPVGKFPKCHPGPFGGVYLERSRKAALLIAIVLRWAQDERVGIIPLVVRLPALSEAEGSNHQAGCPNFHLPVAPASSGHEYSG